MEWEMTESSVPSFQYCFRKVVPAASEPNNWGICLPYVLCLTAN